MWHFMVSLSCLSLSPTFPSTTMTTKDPLDTSFLLRVRQFFLILGAIYVFLVALGMTPLVQRK